MAHAFVDGIVSRSRQHCAAAKPRGNPHYVLAHELAKEIIDRVTIREQLLNVFLPAHDAIASPLTNIFFVLARHPNVFAKLRREIFARGSSSPKPRSSSRSSTSNA